MSPRHVTTAWTRPACTRVRWRAYEKDPVTGIVKHLDDQCFGCQYCTLACPYEAPKYKPFQGHRPQVRHVQRPARRRRSPGLRAVVPERRHRDPRGRRRADRRGIRDPPVRAGRAGAGPDVADHGLPDRASAPAQHGAGGLPHGAARAGALAADPDAGPHAALGRGVPRGTAAGAARSGGADGEHPPGAQRQRAGVRPARARGQRAAPRPPALRLPGRPGPAALVAQPRDPGLRHLCRTGRDLCRLVLGGIGGLAGTTRRLGIDGPRREPRSGPASGGGSVGPWRCRASPGCFAR